MRSHRIATCLLFLLLSVSLALAAYHPLCSDLAAERPQVDLLQSEGDRVQFDVRLPGLHLSQEMLEGRSWDRIDLDGLRSTFEPGMPDVPSLGRMVAIPAGRGVRAEFEIVEQTIFPDIDLMPVQEPDADGRMTSVQYRPDLYQHDAFFPAKTVSAGEPALLRGIRVVPVKINPVQYNPVTRELKVIHRLRITVHFEGTDLRNNPTRALRPLSRTWAQSLKGMLVNYDDLDLDVVPTGSYLLICKNSSTLLSDLEPLIDWKTRKGHQVTVQTFSNYTSTYAVKSMIQEAYDTWEVPPEYVLLWGDTSNDYALPAWTYGVDHPYTTLDGTDILADVAIGRYPADNSYQTQVMVNKVLAYEKNPYTTSAEWFNQAVLVAGSYSSGLSTIQTNQWIKTRLVQAEFARIDTFWYNMGGGTVTSTLTNAINDGVSYVNYRGLNGMEGFDASDIQNLSNGLKLPFVTILTCGTGGFSGYPESNMEVFVTSGSLLNPQGAVACIGTATLYTHTRQNNTIDMGIYAGIFDEGITQAGPALNRGKWELYNTFQDNDPTSVENFSNWNALAGDPGLDLYTGAVSRMECNTPLMVTWGENALALTVTDSGGNTVPDATVCLYKEGELHEVGITDAAGQVILPLDLDSEGNVKVTVTALNYIPIVDSLNVVQTGVTAGYYSHDVDDDGSGTSSGDNDGIINPGETVELPLVWKNYGSATTATGVTVTATTDDLYATIVDGQETFPSIAPGSTASSGDDFDLTIAADCPDGHIVQLNLLTTSDQGFWDGVLNLEVVSSDLEIVSAYATGVDTLVAPGETANFILQVYNQGGKTASSLTATMTSLDSYVTIDDNTGGFGSVGIHDTGDCLTNPFNLTVSSAAVNGHPADLRIEFTTSTGAVQVDTITIICGPKTSTDPQGPDVYGYYCFDDTDSGYPQAPAYNWIEIDPTYGGSGDQLPIHDITVEQDMSVNRTLPFTFRYYGIDVDEITVCSNGWLSTIPNVMMDDFRNYAIPSCIGPSGMIAPFWDDLLTEAGGYVYDYYDATEHTYIVQWSRMRATGSPTTYQTFQVVLFDPAFYPTPSGDGDILFQYDTITEVYGYSTDIPYSTIGIESPDQQDGIEVAFWNQYDDPASAHVQAHRAYLFTTDFDVETSYPDLVVELTYQSGSPVPVGGGNLTFDVFVENQDTTPLNFDAWLEVAYEGGTPTTMIERSFTNYQPGWSVNRPGSWFPVPASYPAGDYTLAGKVGDHPDVIWDESSFPFVKQGATQSETFMPFAPDGMPDPFSMDDPLTAGCTIPTDYALQGAYPNPFNPTTTLLFALPQAGRVELAVYDLRGSLVQRLAERNFEAGIHAVTWDAAGQASGIYFVRLEAGNYHAVQKVVLMK